MLRRRLLLLVLGLAGFAVLGSVIVAWLTAPRHCIMAVAGNPQVIQAGMDQHQVKDLFGVPPGDYTTGVTPLRVADPNGDVPRWHGTADWFADHATVRVYFDRQGEVLFACSVIEDRSPETLWQRLRRRLRL